MSKVLKIDELLLRDHHYLSDDDECYYHMEYMSRAGYKHSDANNLIHNFKKPVTYKGQPAWKYKQAAINEVAALFRKSLLGIIDLDEVTLVPIPPSKAKNDLQYDNRIVQLIDAWTRGMDADVRELLLVPVTMTASHDTNDRPDPEELKEHLSIDVRLTKNIRPTIVLIDDVLTTGAHFVACKNLLLETFPGITVKGVFIARTIWPSAADDFDDYSFE